LMNFLHLLFIVFTRMLHVYFVIRKRTEHVDDYMCMLCLFRFYRDLYFHILTQVAVMFLNCVFCRIKI